MSSFNNPHYFYLFAMRNGKKKLSYGTSPDDAYEVLKLRLSEKEMQAIYRDQVEKIAQRQLRQHIRELG